MFEGQEGCELGSIILPHGDLEMEWRGLVKSFCYKDVSTEGQMENCRLECLFKIKV